MFDKAMKKSIEPYMEPGEELLNVTIVQGKGMTKALLAGGAIGQAVVGAKTDKRFQAEEKAEGAIELSSKMGIGITSQRLLLFKAGGAMTLSAKELLSAVPIADVDSIEVGKAHDDQADHDHRPRRVLPGRGAQGRRTPTRWSTPSPGEGRRDRLVRRPGPRRPAAALGVRLEHAVHEAPLRRRMHELCEQQVVARIVVRQLAVREDQLQHAVPVPIRRDGAGRARLPPLRDHPTNLKGSDPLTESLGKHGRPEPFAGSDAGRVNLKGSDPFRGCLGRGLLAPVLVEAPVVAAEGEEFVVGALLDDPAVLEHDDLARALDR